MKRIVLAILIGFTLTVFFFALGSLFSGGGHDLTAISAFFPYAAITGNLTKDTGWDQIGGFIDMALLAVQFPVYAIILALIKGWRLKGLVLAILLAIHIVTAVIGLRNYYRLHPNHKYGAIQHGVSPSLACASTYSGHSELFARDAPRSRLCIEYL